MSKTVSIDELAKELEKDMLALHKGITIESQSRIIDNAPVSTGALRASILAGVNTEVVEYSKDNTDESGSETKALNENTIMQSKLGDNITITVGAPYGREIEEGSSDKAPSGFVRTVAESLDAIVAEVSKNLEKWR